MTDYKNGRWAAQIIGSQNDDGSWGNNFHSLAIPIKKQPLSTEQALRRLWGLGFTEEDAVIQRALSYIHGCLSGAKKTPDRPEKRMDWEIFISLVLAAWIRRFTRGDALANETAKKWRAVTEAGFKNGKFDSGAYVKTIYEIFEPKYGTVRRTSELLRPAYYYPVLILAGEIGEYIEKEYFDHVMDSETGFYYGHFGPVTRPPEDFRSKEAGRYLTAVELYCEYPNKYCKHKLKAAVDWLIANRNANGGWDMGAVVGDGAHFPLSDSWRTREARETDCTYRIGKILSAIN